MPRNEVTESLTRRQLAVKKALQLSQGGTLQYQEQKFGNVNASKTAADYKEVADDIGWFMKNHGTAEQPSTAYQLDRYLMQEVEQKEVTVNGK